MDNMNRLIDANINRICEGLRIIEDIIRFEINNQSYMKKNDHVNKLKAIRHFIRESIAKKINLKLIDSRDSKSDIGKKLSKIEQNRNDHLDLITANFKRIQEALRVLEEVFKVDKELTVFVKKIKEYRFEIYELEKEIILYLNKQQIIIKKIYAMDISNIDDRIILKSLKNLKNKDIFIEIYSNSLNNANFYKKALSIKNYCLKHDIKFLINNRIDIAIALASNGITIDYDNLPLNIIKSFYKRLIGYTITNTDELFNIHENNFDFFILKDKKFIINHNITTDINILFPSNLNNIKLNFIKLYEKYNL